MTKSSLQLDDKKKIYNLIHSLLKEKNLILNASELDTLVLFYMKENSILLDKIIHPKKNNFSHKKTGKKNALEKLLNHITISQLEIHQKEILNLIQNNHKLLFQNIKKSTLVTNEQLNLLLKQCENFAKQFLFSQDKTEETNETPRSQDETLSDFQFLLSCLNILVVKLPQALSAALQVIQKALATSDYEIVNYVTTWMTHFELDLRKAKYNWVLQDLICAQLKENCEFLCEENIDLKDNLIQAAFLILNVNTTHNFEDIIEVFQSYGVTNANDLEEKINETNITQFMTQLSLLKRKRFMEKSRAAKAA